MTTIDVQAIISRKENEAHVFRTEGPDGLPARSGFMILDVEDAEFRRDVMEHLIYVAWLRQLPYSKYLQTEHWQERRKATLERYDYECWRCNKRTDLQVHHLTYAFRGMESTEELMVLCGDCHKKEHGL